MTTPVDTTAAPATVVPTASASMAAAPAALASTTSTPTASAPAAPATATAAPAASFAARVMLTLLILGACALSTTTWRVYCNTWDEPEHLAAGVELLDRGRYEYDTEHPPIVRALMALGPYLAGARSFGTPPPDGVQEGIDILYTGGHYDLYLTLARLGTLPFLALLLFSTWLWARRLTASEGEALLAVLFVASVPPILGHAALATLDVAAAATVLLAFYAAQRWLESARRRDALWLGLAVGLAVASKFSAIPFLILGCTVLGAARAALRRRKGPLSASRRRWAGVAIILLAAALPVFLAYGFRPAGNTVPRRFDWAVTFLLHEQGLSHLAGIVLRNVWLPDWVKGFAEGIIAVKAHNDSGHLSFLLGQLRSSGWWYFYLVALAAKTPLPLLISGPIGLVLLARDGWREGNAWRLAPALLFVTVLVFASSFSHINIGIRHVLVLYPFLALGAAYAVAAVWRALRKAAVRPLAITGSAFLTAFVGWQVLTLWTASPDYLPYFNEAVAHPQRVLVDSDLDWGQDLWRLEKRAAQIRIPRLHLAYRGTADLAREPLPPYEVMPPGKPATGWVAISALAKVHNPKGYAWLDAYEPMEMIGKSITLYYIPAPR
ncbi:MAG TPA: glycosyltransferase family 39 protein [Steroidobacteraceae bacterium]|nr:glycosyltransferase family 39 protein [Steroidobacteraceae bacterium]